MRPNIDGQAQDRTGVVAHERVHRNHLQIQHVLTGAVDGTGENKHGADVVDLPDVKVSIVISRADAEGVVGSR